ncbi:MAG: hypothetical protein A4E58_02412 [Syntrophorhabdus sp. PtaB.Bin006]|nr:MAG: hypothetical protein A4E58_02412 [Syntrophorhabdus sp. PtaB.Bin006]
MAKEPGQSVAPRLPQRTRMSVEQIPVYPVFFTYMLTSTVNAVDYSSVML